uniref:Uncharacterized protein n=1 Tax=Amphimedon queenslandica TaxID=400682 RepID=A0A1X7UTP8_AMPQE
MAAKTPEAREARLARRRVVSKARRHTENPQERDARQAAARACRDAETPEKRHASLQSQREQETSATRNLCLSVNRDLSQADKMLVSAIMRNVHLQDTSWALFGKQTHKDFHVRRRVVEDALIANNVYYQKIGINLDQDTLAMLPEDGNQSNLHTVQPAESQGVTTSNDTSTTEEEEVYLSFVPNAAPPSTQRETIEQAVQLLGQSQPSHLMWLSIGGTPINEF